jgi:hypothetical protein
MRVAQAEKELEFTLNTFGIAVDADILLSVVKFVTTSFNRCVIVWMLVNFALVNSYLYDAVVKNCTTAKTS